MGIYAGGVEYSKAYVGGVEFTGALAGGESYLAAAPTGLLGYPLDFWAELVLNDDAQTFAPDPTGESMWLRTSDGAPIEWWSINDFPPRVWTEIPVSPITPPRHIGWVDDIVNIRFRKPGLPFIPNDNGLDLDMIAGSFVNGVYRFFSADQPGTLTHGATRRQGSGINLACVISDPDGIASIDAAQLDSTDGRSNDITANWVRRDANSFTHADERTGTRWREASVTVTYTDGNGVQSTLTDSWDV